MPSARALAVISLANSSSLPASASATITATSLADLVTIARIAVSTAIESPGFKPNLDGACAAAWAETVISVAELNLARFRALEQQIERHDFGERCGVAWTVGIGRLQHGAGVGVDDD